MADQQQGQGQGQGGQQIQLRIDESRMKTAYANTIRTTHTPDEVVLDFGMNMPMPGSGGQQAILFDVGARVVLNWRGAKRLAISLAQVINNFERQFGEIPLGNAQTGQPGQGQGGSAPKLAD